MRSTTPEEEKNLKIKGMWKKLTFKNSRKNQQSNQSSPLSSDHQNKRQFSDLDISSSPSNSGYYRNKKGIEGKFHPNIVGVTFLQICHANDLPCEKATNINPFVVVSYGTSTFKTSASKRGSDPVWNEKLFFHVHHTDTNYHLKFTVYDREKFSANNLIGWCQVPIQNVVNPVKKPTANSDMFHDTYETEDDDAITNQMEFHTLPLMDNNHQTSSTLTIRARFMPYQQIRILFWSHLAKVYDAEQTGTLSRLEVQSMLETIGSTITEDTINGFWKRYNKDPNSEQDKLKIDEVVDSLENYMKDDAYWYGESQLDEHNESDLDYTKDLSLNNDSQWNDQSMDNWENIDSDEDGYSEDMSGLSSEDEDQVPFGILNPELFDYKREKKEDEDHTNLVEVMIQQEEDDIYADSLSRDYRRPTRRYPVAEKIIRLRECPICHTPNLAKKSQLDIITHVATCAANDWTSVDRFLMGDFLTEAYAQRRWFVKLARKVSYGKYSLGKDNANILVQDRKTGHLIEEKMSVHVRLGMRLVYKRMRSSIQTKGAQRILNHLTMKQGQRFDSPKSAKEIPGFIKFHQIKLDEVAEPLSSFKTFNEFFYRRLIPSARLPDFPDDPNVAVSPADCRMTAFETVSNATSLWIKGRDFNIKKLLNDPEKMFSDGSLAIFRLAPQDYHRFHFPVDGVVTRIKHISGQYYTVNPMAIRTSIDVFGENARTIVWIDSKEFGQVAVVCVGAMLVGSIIITAKVGQSVKRADEMGYFAFGGSTLVVIFQKDKIIFDHDLLNNSDKALETLVQVGNHIGVLSK